MDSRIAPPTRPDVVTVETIARPTPPPPRVPFAEVLGGSARALVGGAQAAIGSLPGSPLIAVALRNAGMGGQTGQTSTALDVPVSSLGGASAGATVPEGPGGASSLSTASGMDGSAGAGNIEGTLAQSQELNMYYLQVQEQVNAQNRTFTALSNVLEVEHSTAKAAIGNIH